MADKSLQELFNDMKEDVIKFSLDNKVPTDVFTERLKDLEHRVDMLIEYAYDNEDNGIVSHRLNDGSLIQSNVKDLPEMIKDFAKVNKNVWDVKKFVKYVNTKVQYVFDAGLHRNNPSKTIIIKEGAGVL